MKLYWDRKAKDPIYYIQHGFRNGKKTSTKNVKRIGKHSELLLIDPAPLAYAKRQVEKYNEEFKAGKASMDISIDFDAKLAHTDDVASKSNLLNIGYFVLQKIYHDLRIPDFFKGIETTHKATFPCDDINRFLTYARILDPRSKLGTFDRLDSYYELKDWSDNPSFSHQNILRFMDIMEKNYDGYIAHLFANSGNIVKRNTSVCYFDCTNYYFESEGEDEDYVDEVTGEIIRGFRKYGYSKQHQPSPLVQMGLFMDSSGIPISMCMTAGSDNEQTCAVPAEKKIVEMFGGKRFIYCADAGLGSYAIRKYNDMGGRAFIVTQSVKKLSDALQQAVLNDYGYDLLSSDAPVTIKHMKEFDRHDEKNLPLYEDVAYKVLDVANPVDIGLYDEKILKNGRIKKVKAKAVLKQRVIITFSRKMMEYQRHIRNRQIERARFILDHKNVEDVKKGPNDVTRFIKRTSVGKNGENAYDHYAIDQSVIDEEEKYDGYYAVATNLDDDVKAILEINSKRHKIEDCFRVLKTNFRARPVHHRNRNRIIAHFMVCYTALLIYRLLECRLDEYGTHFTTENILETLRNMKVMNVQDLYYASAYGSSKVCTALNGIFDLGLDKKYYQPKFLNKTVKKLLK
jgi:transposase